MNISISTSTPWLLLTLAIVSTGSVGLAWMTTFIFRGKAAALRHFLWVLALSAPLLALPMAWLHPGST